MSSNEIMKTENVLVRTMKLEKNGSTEWHYHSEVRDVFVCLHGALRVETRNPDGETLLIPGQRTEVAPGNVHRVVNAAGDTAEYLLIQGVGKYDFIKVAGVNP